MGKAVADPLFWALSVAVGAQVLLYVERGRRRAGRRLGRTTGIERAARLGLVGLAVATALLWLLGTHAAESFLIQRLGAVHPIPSDEDVARIDVVVVLSGGFVDAPMTAYDQLDSWTTARVVQGVRTFFESDARMLVMTGRWSRSGGGGVDATDGGAAGDGAAASDDGARMALAMKKLAVELGVPAERIVVEPNARTTREHPTELLRLDVVRAGDTIGVVTSSWHLPRAMREFEKHFSDLVAVPAFDVAVDQKGGLLRWMPRSMHLASSATALAEYIGMLWYRVPFLQR